ncbi:hypothetical protein QE152_g7559 [Popillia japonica]|uniref:Uncharacterized protein n=1 Tax=Popillia japonica TaxID=7064 RepID=A0AAW1MG40_POPJA
MEVDTSSAISVISEKEYKIYFKDLKLCKSDLELKSYNGNAIIVLGYILDNAKINDTIERNLKLFAIKNGGLPLIGGDWVKTLSISVDSLFSLSCLNTLNVDLNTKVSNLVAKKFPDG